MPDIVDAIRTAWVPVPCPLCGIESCIRMVEVARQVRVYCRGCHEIIRLVDADASTMKAFRSVSGALSDLWSTLARLK